MAEDKDTPKDEVTSKDEGPKNEAKEAPADSAESTEEGSSPESTGKSKKLIIIVAIAAVILSGVAITTTVLLMGGEPSADTTTSEAADENDKTDEESSEEDGTEDNVSSSAPQFFPIRPAFVVNIPSKGRIRFLQIQVDIMSRDEDVIDEVDAYAPLIKNELVNLFSSQTYEGVISPGGKERLRKKALARVQKVMQEHAGVSGIEQVLFTSFVTQ